MNSSLEGKRSEAVHLRRRLEYAKSTSLENVTEDGSSASKEPTAEVEFRIKFRTEYGQQMKLVGSDRHFGSWAIAKTPPMTWNDGHIWTCVLSLPVQRIYEYKYVIVDSNGATVVRWQQGNNCVLALSTEDVEVRVGDNWEGTPGAQVSSKGLGISTKEEKLLDWAEEMRALSKGPSSLALQHTEALQKAEEENELVRQEASRLKSELRMVSMSRQAAERQVKELQQENRRLLSIMMEQQNAHRSILEQALKILSDPEGDPVLDQRTGQSKKDPGSDSTTGHSKKNPVLRPRTGESEEGAGSADSAQTGGNGSPPSAGRMKSPHSKNRRNRSNKRRKHQKLSTRTAAFLA